MKTVVFKFLEELKDRKNWLSHYPGTEHANICYRSGGWKTISKESFFYMLENRLIESVTKSNDKEYIYIPTHKGINYHKLKD